VVARLTTLQIGSIVAGDLKKHATVRTAFVRLSSGVQESRPEAEAGRHLLYLPPDDESSQGLGIALIHFYVCEQRKIAALTESRQVRYMSSFPLRKT
jgi:hypothetical protein